MAEVDLKKDVKDFKSKLDSDFYRAIAKAVLLMFFAIIFGSLIYTITVING